MDIALQIMINPADHDLSYDSAKEARRFVIGDILDVFSAVKQFGTGGPFASLNSGNYTPNVPIGSPRTAFIFVTGVPDIGIQRIVNSLTKHEVNALDLEGAPLRRRVIGMDISSLPPAKYTELTTNKYTTVTWGQIKSITRNKATGLNITDADI